MKQKIGDAGLEIVKAHYADFPGFFLWWLKYKVLKHASMEEVQVLLYDRYMVPLLKRLEPGRYLPFGKNVLVIGRKT